MNSEINIIVGTIIGAVIGIIGTYFVMKNIQKRYWNRENVKEIYNPLFTEMTSNKLQIERLDEPFKSEWDQIKKEHLIWFIPAKFRENIEKFYEEELGEFKELRRKCMNNITRTIHEFLSFEENRQIKLRTKKEISVMRDSYKTCKDNFLDFSHGIPKYILNGQFENKRFINQYYLRIQDFLKLQLSLDEFYNHFVNEFRKTKEYEEIHNKKEELLEKINELMNGLNLKMHVK